jgi:hypothetical protein
VSKGDWGKRAFRVSLGFEDIDEQPYNRFIVCFFTKERADARYRSARGSMFGKLRKAAQPGGGPTTPMTAGLMKMTPVGPDNTTPRLAMADSSTLRSTPFSPTCCWAEALLRSRVWVNPLDDL